MEIDFFGKCYAFFAGVPNLLYTPPTLIISEFFSDVSESLKAESESVTSQ